jgi:hypothetical protein
MIELSVLVFSEGPKKKVPFAKEDRVVMEDGIPTIRPYRNGKPSSTEKELSKAFEEFRRAIEPDGLFPAHDGVGYIEIDIDLTSHNRSR